MTSEPQHVDFPGKDVTMWSGTAFVALIHTEREKASPNIGRVAGGELRGCSGRASVADYTSTVYVAVILGERTTRYDGLTK